jgi:hypothetical protein
VWYTYHWTTYHCDNAEMTPDLCHDLIKISFDDLQDVLSRDPEYNLLIFMLAFCHV